MPLRWTLMLLWSQLLVSRVTLALQADGDGTWSGQAKVTRFYPSIVANDGNAAFDVELKGPGCPADGIEIALVLSGTATANLTLSGSWTPNCSSATFRAAGSEALRRLPAGIYSVQLLAAPSQQSLPFELHPDDFSDGVTANKSTLTVETTEVTVVQAPTARLITPSVSINSSAAIITLTARLDRPPLLPASLGLRLSDPTAADVLPSVLSWRPGEAGSKHLTLRLNRATGTAKSPFWVEPVAVSNVLLDTAASTRLDLELPVPAFYVVTQQTLYHGSYMSASSSGSSSNNISSANSSSKSGAALYSTQVGGLGTIGTVATGVSGSGVALALLETFGVTVKRAGPSPFPSSLSYLATVLETRGCRSAVCDSAVSGSGQLNFTADTDSATAPLTVNWTVVPAGAALRVGIRLMPENNAAVQTPLGRLTEVLVYGTQYGTCPAGTAGPWLGPAPTGGAGAAAASADGDGGAEADGSVDEEGLEYAAGGGSQMSTASLQGGGGGGSGGACSEAALLHALASYVRGSMTPGADVLPLLAACSGGRPPVVLSPAGTNPNTSARQSYPRATSPSAASQRPPTATTPPLVGLPLPPPPPSPSSSPPNTSVQQPASTPQPPPSPFPHAAPAAVTELHVPYQPQLAAVFVPLLSPSETVVVLQSNCSQPPSWDNVRLPGDVTGAVAAIFSASPVPAPTAPRLPAEPAAPAAGGNASRIPVGTPGGTGGGPAPQAGLNTGAANASGSGGVDGGGSSTNARRADVKITTPVVWARWLLPALAQPCSVQVGVYDTVILNSASQTSASSIPPLQQGLGPPAASPPPPAPLGAARPSPRPQSDPSDTTRGISPSPAAAATPSPSSRSPAIRALIATTGSPSSSPSPQAKPPAPQPMPQPAARPPTASSGGSKTPSAAPAAAAEGSPSAGLPVYSVTQLRTHSLLLRPRGDPEVLSGRALALALQHGPSSTYLPLCGLAQPLLAAAVAMGAGAVGPGAAAQGSNSGRGNSSSTSGQVEGTTSSGPVLAWAAATLARAIRGDPDAVQALRQQSQLAQRPQLLSLMELVAAGTGGGPRPSLAPQQVAGPSPSRPATAPSGRRLTGLLQSSGLGRWLLGDGGREMADGRSSGRSGARGGPRHAAPNLRRIALVAANSSSGGGGNGSSSSSATGSPIKPPSEAARLLPPTVLGSNPTLSPAASTPGPSPNAPQSQSSPGPGAPRRSSRGQVVPPPEHPPTPSSPPPVPAPVRVLPRPGASGIRAPEGFDLPLYPGVSSSGGGGGGTARVLFNREFMEWCDPGVPQALDLALLPSAYDMTLQATSSAGSSSSVGGGGVVGLAQLGGAAVLGQGIRTALVQRRDAEEEEAAGQRGLPGSPATTGSGVPSPRSAPGSPTPAHPGLTSIPDAGPPDSTSLLAPGSPVAVGRSSTITTRKGPLVDGDGGALGAEPPDQWLGGEAPEEDGRDNSDSSRSSPLEVMGSPPGGISVEGNGNGRSGGRIRSGRSPPLRAAAAGTVPPSSDQLSSSSSSPGAGMGAQAPAGAAGAGAGGCGAASRAAEGGGSVLPSADERLVVTLMAPDGITTTSLALNLYVDYGQAAAAAVAAAAAAAVKCTEPLPPPVLPPPRPASSSSSNSSRRAPGNLVDPPVAANSSSNNSNNSLTFFSFNNASYNTSSSNNGNSGSSSNGSPNNSNSTTTANSSNNSSTSSPSRPATGGSDPVSPSTSASAAEKVSSGPTAAPLPTGAAAKGAPAPLRVPPRPPPSPPPPPDACRACGPGTYSATPNASTCLFCAPGSYAGGAVNAECMPCPAGMYTFAWGSTVCRLCVAGSYAPRPASTACSVCPSETTSVTPGARECVAPAPPPAPDAGSRVVVVVSFGLLLNLSQPGSVSQLMANTTGIDASPDSIVKLLVAADTADALGISPTQVRVSLFEITPSAFLVNVSATVPMGVGGSGSATGGADGPEGGSAAAVAAVDADTLIGRLVRSPEDSFPRTKDTTGGSLQVQYVDRQVVTLDAGGGSINLHAVLWPTLAGTALMALALGLVCKRYCGRRRSRNEAALPPLSDALDRLCPWRAPSGPPAAMLVYGSLASLELQELNLPSPAAVARHRGRGGSKAGLPPLGLSVGPTDAVSGGISNGGGLSYGSTADYDVLKLFYTRDAMASQHI